MFKCSVCGYIHDGDEAPARCPKCGAVQDRFEKLSEEAAALIDKSRITNSIHMQLINDLENIALLAEEGLEEDLDPNCNKIFERLLLCATESIQSIKAEMQGHMNKGKWG
ncbi:rubredoxin-like domain-containing protein [Heliophilum fasciatum]|uniref:Rubredoxin-like domain-containing protein n=1 Tax=Heliophilum fasciatum TaxID=35700 RepID=A0A4R2RXD6_9FIRM|nr:rubredoxin [Heliophilum fasciatum]MCW2277182.1 putative nucleic acid-binding Zn-ribbon protein [Heliophilum fasciatum]TCP68183.1 hypothetical protein EDD73_10486 [Heliophilum fasciatum]